MLDSYSKIIAREGHATPTTIVVRAVPSPRNPQNKYPDVSEVTSGVVFGPGQKQGQEYETGTATGGSGGGVEFIEII